MSSSSKQIKMGAIVSYIAIFFNVATGLTYTPWMINKIGESEYGLYTLAMSLISFFAVDFGLGSAVSRFISTYKANNDEEKINDFLGITFKLYIIIDFIIAFVFIISFCFVDKIYIQLTPIELQKFRVIFAIGAIFSVISFPFSTLNGILISDEKFIFIKTCDFINKVLTVGLMIICLLLGFRLYAIVVVNAFVGVLIIILKLNFIYKKLTIKINFNSWNKNIIKELFGFSVWTTIISIAQRFIMLITPSILAIVSGSLQITLFSVASIIEGYTWTFSNALNGLFLPRISRISISENSSDKIEELMIKVGRIQFFIVGLIISGFIILGKDFMTLWMGESYEISYYITILLILPCIVTLTQDIANTALIAANEIKYRAFGTVITAVVSLLISFILSSRFGGIGAAIAICIGTCLGNILWLNFVYYKILSVNIFKFFRKCHLKMILPLSLSLVLGFIAQNILPTTSIIIFIVKGILYTLLYIVLMWKYGFNNYEKNLFLNIYKK